MLETALKVLVWVWTICTVMICLFGLLLNVARSTKPRQKTAGEEPLEHAASYMCWCNPETEPVERPDGSVGWMIIHRDPVQELIDDVKKAAE